MHVQENLRKLDEEWTVNQSDRQIGTENRNRNPIHLSLIFSVELKIVILFSKKVSRFFFFGSKSY